MRARNKDKVLIIVENLPVPHDKRVWQEARSLTRAGYTVTVISPRGKDCQRLHEVIEGISIYRHPLPFEARGAAGYLIEYPWAFVCQFVLAAWVYLTNGFAVIHACNPPDNIYLIARVFRLFCGTLFVFDHHDGNPELWVAKGGTEGGFVHRALCLIERQSFRAADVSLAVNDHFRKVAVNRGKMDPAAVFLVRNAPDRILVEDVIHRTAQVQLPSSRRCVVGFLGVMGIQDGVANLMHIAHHLVMVLNRKDIVFRIMGDGPELASVKALAIDLGIQASVEFTGWISGDEYLDKLASCDIGVNADTANGYNEFCSPNKIYEYMLFGLPIVQFDLPEARLISGEAALNAQRNDNSDLASKLIRLADDEELRGRMGAHGRRRFLDHFLWDNAERELLNAYQRILPLR